MLLSARRVSVLLVAIVVVLALSIRLLGAVGSASAKDNEGRSAAEDIQALTPIVGEVSNAPSLSRGRTEEHT